MAAVSPAAFEVAGLAVAVADGERRFRVRLDALSLAAGAVVALTGSSGTGKTMVLETLGLLRRPLPGARMTLRPAGAAPVELAALWDRGPRSAALAEARGRHFGFVPQSGGLLPFLSVDENIRLPQILTGRHDPAHLAALAARLGLGGLGALPPAALSIGQRQRAAIARALAHRPAVVLADAPTAALDPNTAEAALALLIDTARLGGAAVILASHDLVRLDRLAIPCARIETGPDPDMPGALLARVRPPAVPA